jgi:hypothetical protein
LTKYSDHYAEIDACGISDELFNYVMNGGPEPASWAEVDDDEVDNWDFAETNEDTDCPDEIGQSDLQELTCQGLQIFLGEIFFNDDTSTVSLQFLFDHGRSDVDDNSSLEDAINELEPLLPERAEFEICHSNGTDIFLLRELETEDLKPEKLDALLQPLTKFAEFAMTKVSILHTAPEFKLRNRMTTS